MPDVPAFSASVVPGLVVGVLVESVATITTRSAVVARCDVGVVHPASPHQGD